MHLGRSIVSDVSGHKYASAKKSRLVGNRTQVAARKADNKALQFFKVALPYCTRWDTCVVIIKVFRTMSVLYIIYSIGCIIVSIGTRSQQLALVSANSAAEVSGNYFGHYMMRQLFTSVVAPTPIVTPPGIIDSVQLVPQAVKNLAISDVTPLIGGASTLVANMVIKRMLKF